MTKQIKVPDDVYTMLLEEANKQDRTLGGQISYLLKKNKTGVTENVYTIDAPVKDKYVPTKSFKDEVLEQTTRSIHLGRGGLVESGDSCPHGYGKGMCKKPECNRKYR